MDRAEYWKIITATIDWYGLEEQCDQAKEEMAELVVAISKWWRGAGKGQPLHADIALDVLRENIADEIADVLITMDELIQGYGCAQEVNEHIQYKVNRLRQRLEDEGCTIGGADNV